MAWFTVRGRHVLHVCCKLFKLYSLKFIVTVTFLNLVSALCSPSIPGVFQLTLWHKLMFRPQSRRAECLTLGFIFSNHLAHSQFQSGPWWKWHKLLFGLPYCTVPLLLFSSWDYWANLRRINRGEGIPFVQWEQEINSVCIMHLTFRLPWAASI